MSGNELLVGKTDACGLRLDDDGYASRLHARVFCLEGRMLLEDLGSANGTFVRVRRPVALEPGDEFLIGTTKVQVQSIL